MSAVLTDGARRFVTDELFAAFTRQPSPTHLHADPLWHTDQGRCFDLCVVAPASANFLARLAAGMADDLLLATMLVSSAPKMLVPAMNEGMWRNPLTQENIAKLKRLGYQVMQPDHGWLACGIEGEGRFPDVQRIVEYVRAIRESPLRGFPRPSWTGRRVLVTLGPTREAIDSVRYISNRSSGKLGLAIAQACLQQGAQLTLLSGLQGSPALTGARVLQFESTQQLQALLQAELKKTYDILFMCAAVSDYRPKKVASSKLPRNAK